jgi:hypothetical protein
LHKKRFAGQDQILHRRLGLGSTELSDARDEHGSDAESAV